MNCGIYKITNIRNKKVYVGSSVVLDYRLKRHLRLLRAGNHHSKHLQESFNLYGEYNFKFEIIEFIKSKGELIEREQYWIDFYKSYQKEYGYNMCKIAGNVSGLKHSKESIAKIRLSRIGKKINEKSKLSFDMLNNTKKKKVINLNTGKIFDTAREASLFYGMKSFESIKNVCRGKGEFAGGYRWRYLEDVDNLITIDEPLNPKEKKVRNTTTGKTFDSITEASLFYDVSKCGIVNVCKNRRKTAGGYQWSYL